MISLPPLVHIIELYTTLHTDKAYINDFYIFYRNNSPTFSPTSLFLLPLVSTNLPYSVVSLFSRL